MMRQIGAVKQVSKSDFDARMANSKTPELRVLLAEDTPINAEAMKAMASHLSVQLEVAANGLDAIEMVQQALAEARPYSLLLIDVMMPILDGIETTKRIRALGIGEDRLPIIAVTAATSFDEIRSYRACGMQAFLSKPVALTDLRATFEAWGHTSKSKPVARPARIEPAVLDVLKEQFHERNKHTLALAEHALASDPIEEGLVDDIRNLLHQIAGTATTFGDAELSASAKALEDALIEAQATATDVRPALKQTTVSLRKRVGSR